MLIQTLEFFVGEVPEELLYLTLIFGYQLAIILIMSFIKFMFSFANIITLK